MSQNEVDLIEAMVKLDVPEEVLGILVEERKLKSRRADGTIYFLRKEINELAERTRRKSVRQNEVDLIEAMDMLDVPEDVLVKRAEEGKLKSRRADCTIYFLRDEIDDLIDRQIKEGWSEAIL